MSATRDAGTLGRFFARAARRIGLLAAARGFAAGLAVAGVATLAAPSVRAALVMLAAGAVAGATAGWLAANRSRRQIAARVERGVPGCRNIVITAEEILAAPDRVRPYIAARVANEAAMLVGGLDLRRLFPATRTILATVAGVALSSAAVVVTSQRSAAGAAPAPSSEAAAAIARVRIVVTPPAYTGRAADTLTDPAGITAIAGSRLAITVEADAAGVWLDSIAGRTPLVARGRRTFSADVIADADGFLGVEPAAANGRTGLRRLVGLVVTPDRAPDVRVTAPGQDLLLPDARRAIPIAVEAADDFGLTSLRMPYTKVTGSGENFTFASGEITLTLSRASGRKWTGQGALRLDGLALEPGDMVIYRGVANDARPGAIPAESDAFIVEIAAAGALIGEGFAVDDRQDRYAISQQMVIVKTERLIGRRASLAAAALADESLDLAAEQRQVRAEFVFMMGGELADAGLDAASLNEEVEAEREDDLAAGRLVNQGRADLMRAIRSMSRAAAFLGDRDLTRALEQEKAALASLQRAFTRSRYILRTLGARERLDLSRRLTGVLAALARVGRPALEATPGPRVAALRRALADLTALAAGPARGDEAAARAQTIAASLLRVDPASAPVQTVARHVDDAAGHFRGLRDAAARARIDVAAMALAALVRAELAIGPARTPSLNLEQLNGALTDALRRTGGRR